MKLKRIISLCAVVAFGASTAIYAGNVSKTEEKTAEESFEQENKDSMSENEQLAGVELSMPGNEEGWAGQILKYSTFYYDALGAMQIVTKVNEDGTFLTEDLGVWLKKQDVYDISVLKTYEDAEYCKKLIYKSRPENQARAEFQISDDTDYLPFEGLVSPGEIIMFQGGYQETVDEVYPDGSFTTDYSSDTVWGK